MIPPVSSRTVVAVLATSLATFSLTILSGCGVDRIDRTVDNQQNQNNDEPIEGCETPEDGELLECIDRDPTPSEPIDSDRCNCFREHLELESLADSCVLSLVCGDQAGIDCDSAVDGPYYYVDADDGDILGRCGGYCNRTDPEYCDHCPPDDWSCEETY